jgi:hypothetical protein
LAELLISFKLSNCLNRRKFHGSLRNTDRHPVDRCAPVGSSVDSDSTESLQVCNRILSHVDMIANSHHIVNKIIDYHIVDKITSCSLGSVGMSFGYIKLDID